MSLGQNDNYLILEFTKLKDENARLKADVRNCYTAIRVKDEENASLQAEVERLGAFRTHTIIPNEILKADNARLKAEVERLEHLVNYWRIEAETDNARWLRCLEDMEKLRKEGKQS